MAEHVVHEWAWLGAYSREQKAYISGVGCICGEMMDFEEASRRLNATERLSAEDARLIVASTDEDHDRLRAYAAALEEQDG